MDWANQEVSATRLKQESSVALFVLVFCAGKYFLKVGGHGMDPHSVSPWICWRTWELRFIQLPEQASMLPSPITCHSPYSVMACLFLQHLVIACLSHSSLCWHSRGAIQFDFGRYWCISYYLLHSAFILQPPNR